MKGVKSRTKNIASKARGGNAHAATHHGAAYRHSDKAPVPATSSAAAYDGHPDSERNGQYHPPGEGHHGRSGSPSTNVKGTSFTIGPSHHPPAQHGHQHAYAAVPPPAPPGYHGPHGTIYPAPAQHYASPYHPHAAHYLPPPMHHHPQHPPPPYPHPHHHQQHPPPQPPRAHPSSSTRADRAHDQSSTMDGDYKEEEEEAGQATHPKQMAPNPPERRKRGRPRKFPLLEATQPSQKQRRKRTNSISSNSSSSSGTKGAPSNSQKGRAPGASRQQQRKRAEHRKASGSDQEAAGLAAALAEENHKLQAALELKTKETEKYKAQAQSLTARGAEHSAAAAERHHRHAHGVAAGVKEAVAAAASARNERGRVDYDTTKNLFDRLNEQQMMEVVNASNDDGHTASQFVAVLKRHAAAKEAVGLGTSTDSSSQLVAELKQHARAAAANGRTPTERENHGGLGSGILERASDARLSGTYHQAMNYEAPASRGRPTSDVLGSLASFQQQRLIQEEQEKQVLKQIAARRTDDGAASTAGSAGEDTSFQNLFIKERQFNEELQQQLAMLRNEKAKGDSRSSNSKLTKDESLFAENRRLKGRIRDLEKTLVGLRVALGEQEKKTAAAMVAKSGTEGSANLAGGASAPLSSGGADGMLSGAERQAPSSATSDRDELSQGDSNMISLLKKRLVVMDQTLEQVVNERDAVLRAHQEQQKNLLLLDDEVERQLVKNKTLAAEIDASHRQLQDSTMRRTILVRRLEDACRTNDSLEKRIQEMEASNGVLRDQIVRWDGARGAGTADGRNER